MRLDDIMKGYKSTCFLGNCLLDPGHWGVNSSEKNKVNTMAAQYGTSSTSGAWTLDDLPDMAMEQKNLM